MSRTLLQTLRQPRYAALSALMVVVAIGCVAAGTWQVARLQAKVAHNDDYRRNAHAPVAAVGDVLPLVGGGHTPSAYDVEFRRVSAAGTFDAAHQSLVRQRSVNDELGYLVLTPLRTAEGTLLVVRGFIPASAAPGGTPTVAPPPTDEVQVVGRVHPAEKQHDQAGALPGIQVRSVNPADQAQRLGTEVFDGYVVLEPGQPGVDPLVAVPEPDLSNPAGGAVEPQHIAYVIQWYLFALLALAAPIAMVRVETRQHAIGDIGDIGDIDEHGEHGEHGAPDREPSIEPTAEQARAAKLADRYGRAR